AGVHPAPARMEAFWTRALAPLRDHPRVRDVRARGTIAAVELDVPGGYLADVGRQLRRHCLDRGVLLRPLGNVLYALPPSCTSDAPLTQIADAMRGAVRAWRGGRQRPVAKKRARSPPRPAYNRPARCSANFPSTPGDPSMSSWWQKLTNKARGVYGAA